MWFILIKSDQPLKMREKQPLQMQSGNYTIELSCRQLYQLHCNCVSDDVSKTKWNVSQQNRAKWKLIRYDILAHQYFQREEDRCLNFDACVSFFLLSLEEKNWCHTRRHANKRGRSILARKRNFPRDWNFIMILDGWSPRHTGGKGGV